MYFERDSFIKSLQERIALWDRERLQRFLIRHAKELPNAVDLETHWDACRKILLDNLDALAQRIPEVSKYDDHYMTRLLVVIYEKALQRAIYNYHHQQHSPPDTQIIGSPPTKPKIALENLLPGDFISDYEIIDVLGEGAMGVVYLTQHKYLMRRFALKVMSSQFSERPEFASIFLQEARTLGNLKHPHLVEVHNFGVYENAQFLVMEYIKGGTMTDYLKTHGGRLDAKKTLEVMEATLEALAHAHRHNVIHRDLKPDNLMLTEGGTVKIADFGLAYLCDSELSEDERMANRLGDGTWLRLAEEQAKVSTFFGGTKGYMAPEVAAGHLGDKRADYFAIGVIIYQFITGNLPEGKRQPASEIIRGLDPRWDQIIDKCMEARPANRYQDAAGILHDIRQLKDRPSTVSKPRRTFRFPKIPIFGILKYAIAITILGGGGYYVFSKMQQDSQFLDKLGKAFIAKIDTLGKKLQESNIPDFGEPLPNVLLNGSFESGMDGWQLEHFDTQHSFANYSEDQARDGKYYAKLLVSPNSIGWARITTPITADIKSGSKIILSAWIRSPSATPSQNIDTVLLIRGMDSGRKHELGSASQAAKAKSYWSKVELAFTVPSEEKWPGLGRLEIQLMVHNINNRQTEIHVDAVRVSVEIN